MRLISQSWNCLVTECLYDKYRFAVIDNILFHFEDNAYCYHSKLNRVEIFRNGKFERHVTYIRSSDQQLIHEKRKFFNIPILLAISRCAYIDTLTMNLISVTALRNVQSYLGKARIRLLKINQLSDFDRNKRDALVTILRANNVQKLEIHEVSSQVLIDLEGTPPENWYALKFITLYNYYAPTDYGHQKDLWKEIVRNINQQLSNCQASLHEVVELNTPSRQCLRFRMAVLPCKLKI